MPIYRCTISAGLLDEDQKSQLAAGFADVHCNLTNGTPRKFVHVIFEELTADNSYSGGVPATASRIVGLIRSGRTQQTRSDLVSALTDLWARVTGQSNADIVVALTEARPKDIMEWGEFLPEDGEEASWVEQHGLASQGVVAT
jgi:phenylpyruvate tautomerase PptA (4-oxalocrotonate tautomerase family)